MTIKPNHPKTDTNYEFAVDADDIFDLSTQNQSTQPHWSDFMLPLFVFAIIAALALLTLASINSLNSVTP